MYTSFSDQFWKPLKAGLAARYPWIDFQTLDLNGPEILERYRMEKGGSARTADILVFNGPAEWADLGSSGDILDYRSPEIPHLPDWAHPKNGVYVITVDTDTFFWNKLLLPQGPTSLTALVEQAKANPDMFRGRLATYAIYQQSSYYLSFRALLAHHGDTLWDWLEVLGPLTRVERSGGTMFEKVLTGEYLAAYYVNQQLPLLGMRDPQKNKVFDWSFPTDGTPVSPRFGGIPVSSQAPNSAKLILDFLLSKEGQVLISEGGRLPYRADVTAADIGPNAYSYQMVSEKVGADNTLLVEYDPMLMEDQEEIVARWKKIYRV